MKTELEPGEFHPMAPTAFKFVKAHGPESLMMLKEALASSALSGTKTRTAEICIGTIDRILTGQGVSDRYVFGLAWLMMMHRQDQIAKPLLDVSELLATALRDTLTTFRDDDKTVLVTTERQEAWTNALTKYDELIAFLKKAKEEEQE